MSRSPFLSLPPELHALIFSHLSQARCLYFVSLTSRYLSILAAPHLFKLAITERNAYALRWAASVNNTSLMTRLLHAGVDASATEVIDGCCMVMRPEMHGLDYRTALDIAVQARNLDALNVLLEHGNAVRARDLARSLTLTIAVYDPLPMLDMLLEYIPPYHRCDSGYLVWGGASSEAVRSGKRDVVKFFFDRGVEFSADPLHIAVSHQRVGIARLLLERDAIADIGARSHQWSDMTALDLAANYGGVEFISLLLQHGAKVDCASSDGIQAVHRVAKWGMTKPNNGTTPMHLAARHNRYSTLQALIEMGGDVNATDNDGHAALYHAAKALCSRQSGYRGQRGAWGVNLAWLLLRSGARLDNTIINAATREGRVGMARALRLAKKMQGIENVAASLEELYDLLLSKRWRTDPDFYDWVLC
ncbi:ankyrin repeat-containing domain protein [Trichophaea hybrida]|nr:ankyrin repeat-containing domain protein [Trichophaea hybrida]